AGPPGAKVVADAPLEDGLGALAFLGARASDVREMEREVYELALVDLLDDAVGVRADHRRRPSARRVSSATSSLRNSPLAWKSLRGSQASAASSAASATASSPRSLPASACSAAVARSGVGPTPPSARRDHVQRLSSKATPAQTEASAKSPARSLNSSNTVRAPSGGAGKRASSSTSSGASEVVNGPRKKSAAAIARRPAGPSTSSSAS